VSPPNIGFFGLEAPEQLIGVVMDYQVAQKLHAASEPDTAGYENQRVHDVADLLLLRDAFYPGPPPPSLKAACVDIFEYRANEARQLERPARVWPPALHLTGFWRMAWPPLAASLDLDLTVEEAIAAVETWVQDIDQADTHIP
jgi:hypothetical protein